MKPIVVVATDEEYTLAQKRFKGHRIIQTGVGGINVIETLKRVPKWRKIINFGYAGSNNIPVGTEMVVGIVELHHEKAEYKEKYFILPDYWKGNGVTCYTSTDFVTETKINKACLFDMELAYIMALGFKNVRSIKIVSDNLNQKEYEKTIKKA